MNEFEWRRQLRDLRQPFVPPRDLWTSIDAALDNPSPGHAGHATTRRPPRWRRLWLAAASLAALAVLAGGIGLRLHHPAPTTTALAAQASWKPADPRLSGAAIELDAAHMEIQQALQQAPDSSALQRLLAHTRHQQQQLRQLAHEAS